MAKILIAGAFGAEDIHCKEFTKCLGEEVIEQGHDLLNACRNEFDQLVAKSAFELLSGKGTNPAKRLISYVAANSEPVHQFGSILRSRLSDWDFTFKRLQAPEPVALADAVIIVGGSLGTMRAANWARYAKKPLLPITNFGGAAAEIYKEEIKEFQSKYAERVDRLEYEVLNQVSSDWRKIAKEVVSLAARLISSRQVCVVMSYSQDPKLVDAYESYQSVCQETEFGYECRRVDDTNSTGRIVPEVLARIEKAAFVIVDVSEEKANVYYELGFAEGLGKPVIITAFKGTALPFDIKDIPIIFWEGQKQLKDRLRERIALIASSQGRE